MDHKYRTDSDQWSIQYPSNDRDGKDDRGHSRDSREENDRSRESTQHNTRGQNSGTPSQGYPIASSEGQVNYGYPPPYTLDVGMYD